MHSNNTNREVVKLFFEISKTINQSMRENFHGSEVTMPQGIVLFTLCEYGEMKISDISEKVQLSNSTVSGIVDRLEKQGLVERTRNSEDRRTVYVKITNKFKEEHKGLHEKSNENFIDLLRSATEQDLEKIFDGLNILKKILNNRKER